VDFTLFVIRCSDIDLDIGDWRLDGTDRLCSTKKFGKRPTQRSDTAVLSTGQGVQDRTGRNGGDEQEAAPAIETLRTLLQRGSSGYQRQSRARKGSRECAGLLRVSKIEGET
jgi:hypothetical protein